MKYEINKTNILNSSSNFTFLHTVIMASGLDKNDAKSSKPIKYTHLDIAGSAGDIPFPPTGSPILALAQLHLLN